MQLPNLGYGLGLRPLHYETILAQPPHIDWFEILTEDYLVPSKRASYYLQEIAARYPVVMHGVSLSIGSSDPLNWDYIRKVRDLADATHAVWISDHLSWTGVDKINLHDLLPMPYTDEALTHIVKRVQQVQDFLGRRLVLENVSSYLTYPESQWTEWDFIAAVAEQADCLILLDVNNIYVSACNHQFDPVRYIQAIPQHRVPQFHVAGHRRMENYILDTHDAEVIQEVWTLYKLAVQRFPQASTLLERDDQIPALAELVAELDYARSLREGILNAQQAESLVIA